MLLAEADRRIGIVDRIAGLIGDPRDPALVTHSVASILRARVLAIACGYEDASVLTGLIPDASGEAMSPSFGYGRHGGRLPALHVHAPLQVGKTKPAGDFIRRVSASVVEAYLAAQLSRVMGREVHGADDLKAYLRRVELRSSETHVVLDVGAIYAGEHPDLARQALEQRRRPGEQLLPEPGVRDAIRLVLPQRLQLRGGQTWINGSKDVAPVRSGPGLMDGLKAAHAELAGLKASSLTSKDELIQAEASANQHQRQVSRLAFLAPDLQRRILCGAQPARLNLRTILKFRVPLAGADQHA
jgi:hypothetical protein